MQLAQRRPQPLPQYSAQVPRRFSHVIRCVSVRAEAGAQSLRPTRVSVPNDDTGGRLDTEVLVDPSSRIFTVSIKKPLGIVFTQRGGRIVVESVNSGGHAAVAGVAAGDVLLATSARAQVDSGRDALRGQLVLLPTAGEGFKTVAAAIRSNTCSQCSVHLVLERPREQAGNEKASAG